VVEAVGTVQPAFQPSGGCLGVTLIPAQPEGLHQSFQPMESGGYPVPFAHPCDGFCVVPAWWNLGLNHRIGIVDTPLAQVIGFLQNLAGGIGELAGIPLREDSLVAGAEKETVFSLTSDALRQSIWSQRCKSGWQMRL
jgi:hypothetical protein